jgi:polysaccharide biosynthesis PFTS motif protein
MVWYSQNAMPFVYEGGGSYDSEPRCRHICVDETWVWTQGFEKWLRGLGITGPIHVVGPILWYLPEAPALRKDTDIRVVVCDVTPLRDDVALQIGLAENYYSGTNMIRFIEEILWCCRELEARSGRPMHLSLKHKRSYNMKTHDPCYIEYIGRLCEPGGGVELIPFWANMYALFANSDLVIVAPYSSPTYVASTGGIRAIYFDPTKELVPTFEPAPLVEFASGRAELLRVVSEAVSAPRLHNVYARN